MTDSGHDFRDDIDQLLDLAVTLSSGDKGLAAWLLLHAVALLSPDKATYFKAAEAAFDAYTAAVAPRGQA